MSVCVCVCVMCVRVESVEPMHLLIAKPISDYKYLWFLPLACLDAGCRCRWECFRDCFSVSLFVLIYRKNMSQSTNGGVYAEL